jgi:hypothetical protein
MGDRFRASGRGHLRHLVHARRERQGLVHVDDGLPDRRQHFSGTLFRSVGPPLDAPFDPNQVVRTAVGSGTLSFSDANNGTFSYTVNGVSQTKAITKQVFGPVPTCTWGALSNLALATNYTDLWWVTGGSRVRMGDQLHAPGRRYFATWFTYDFTGAALPMSATLNKVGPATYSGSSSRPPDRRSRRCRSIPTR